MKAIRRAAILAASLSIAFALPSAAQEVPLTAGDYVEVTTVTIDDGHNLDYAKFLAGAWRTQQVLMKVQGWITGYEILANVHKRPGEADLYLVQRSKGIPDAAEIERRNRNIENLVEHGDKMKMTDAEMEASSGERAKFRHVTGTSLMQVLNFR